MDHSLIKSKRWRSSRTKDALEDLVKLENYEDSLVTALLSIIQGEEDYPKARRACMPKCAKVIVEALRLN